MVCTPRGAWVCTRKDFERRHDWCKHGLSVALLRSCQEPQTAPPPDPDAPIPFELTPAALAVAV